MTRHMSNKKIGLWFVIPLAIYNRWEMDQEFANLESIHLPTRPGTQRCFGESQSAAHQLVCPTQPG